MNLRWFLYYCAAWGAFGGLVGWIVSLSVLMDKPVLQEAFKGMGLGLVLAIILVLVDRAFNGFSWTVVPAVFVGAFVGGLGGFVGGMIAQIIYGSTQWNLSLVFGWTLTGLLIGASPGMFELLARLARNQDTTGAFKKVRNGLMGGTIGGMLGGGFFLAVGYGWKRWLGIDATGLWSPTAIGFVILGACIGLLIGLVQVIFKDAWIKVESGFRAGRELILSRPEIIIGRAEGCDIALFGDQGVDKLHARIVTRDGGYYVEDIGSGGGTSVNGYGVIGLTRLNDGDLIEIGRSSLRFSAQGRTK
ncbi:MAG: FHA domain-containing protein [Planctomycetia bacterium]|nr:FHA domain-containing protein [Planctomycetia bacterium]